jgi:DNA gyrase subunit A
VPGTFRLVATRKKSTPKSKAAAQPAVVTDPSTRIEDINVQDELESSYLEYALSVIVSRAIPDARDGLKPVQRRLLYAMLEGGQRSDKPHRKSVSAVGDTMKKYHPHGDQSIYDTLVRMAQWWSMRLPLVDGHGNFGSRDDGPAAYRYCVTGDTRIRLADGSTPRIDSLGDLSPNSDTDIDVMVLDECGKPARASKFFHSGSHPVKRVTLKGGLSLRGSHNHPILTLTPVAGVPMLQWKRLDEIHLGDVVCVARNGWRTDTPLALDHMTGVLLGAWVSEGFVSEGRAGFNNTDKQYFDEVLLAYDQIVGGTRYVAERKLRRSGKSIYEIDIHNLGALAVSPLAGLSGLKAAAKAIPETVWHGSAGLKRAFLQALFEGDGHIQCGPNNGFTVQYSSYSEELVTGIQQLLLEFGLFATINTYVRASGNTEYRIVISARDQLFAFHERVGFLTAKRVKLQGILDTLERETHKLSSDSVPFVRDFLRSTLPRRRGGGRSWLGSNNVDSIPRWTVTRKLIKNRLGQEVYDTIAPLFELGYRYVPVTAVEDCGVEPVFSIRVDSESHAFMAGGFINHNTEARLDPAAEALLASVDEETVDMIPNFDSSMEEPVVLPAGFPNLLVNGAAGIAVGMATNIPPHNLSEVAAACQYLLENPKASSGELMKFIPGPDFPTGGVIIGSDGTRDAYLTGKGAIRVRARCTIEDVSPRKRGIVVRELPYTVGPERVVARIKELVSDKKIDGISDIKDLSDRKNGLRLVIEVRTGFDPTAILARLYKLTPLEENFSVNAVSLIDGKPQVCTLEDFCRAFVDHRLDVIVRRTKHRLAKTEARAHILEGLIKALASIDDVVAIIRASKDTASARTNLKKRLVVTDIQADAILEMPLRRLTSLEVSKLKAEHKGLLAEIKMLKAILASPKRQREVVSEELNATVAKFATPRRTTIQAKDDMAEVIAAVAAQAVAPAAAATQASVMEIADEPCVVFATADGVARLIPGGKGAPVSVVGAVVTTTRARIGVIRADGTMIPIDVAEIVEASARGRSTLTPLSSFGSAEKAVGVVTLDGTVGLGTAAGVVKRLSPEALPTAQQFQRAGSEGVSLISLEPGDHVVAAGVADDASWMVFVTSDAQLLRFAASGVRPQGRTAGGMSGVKLDDGSRVIAFAAAPSDMDGWKVATVSDAGNAKWTPLAEYPPKGRSTMGVRCQAFKKSDTRLSVAVVGADVAGLSRDASKRDASGSAADSPPTLSA